MSLPVIRKIARLFFIFTFITAFSLFANAYPGEPDTTFNNTGFARFSFGLGNDGANAVAVQTDGKIIAAGYAVNGYAAVQGGDEDFALVRYNADGSLDTSFGEGGKAVFHIKISKERANAVAVQPDGKIVAAGVSSLNYFDSNAVIRFNADGSLDTSFGGGGFVITQIGYGASAASGVAIQSDGKIVTTGYSPYGFSLVRYNDDGSRDENFGNNGIVSFRPAANSSSIALAIQPDGKIVVGGAAGNGSYNNFALARFNENGTLDKRFGLYGRVIVPIGTYHAGIYALALQTDGKIVAGGFSYNGTSYTKFTVARFQNSGRLDTSFGSEGKIVTAFGNNEDLLHSIALQKDGSIVAAGHSYDGNRYRSAIARYKADGTLDNLFGTGGKVITYFQNNVTAYGVALQTDGKILTAGLTTANRDGDFAVIRYHSDGSFDSAFDTDGKAVTDVGSAGGEWKSVLVQNDSKIIAIGYGFNQDGQTVALARYNADGSLDSTFGANNGKVLTRISYYGDGLDGVLQPDGKIVICSYYIGGYAIVRYNSDGSLDNSFGTNGIKFVDFGYANQHAAAVDIQSDGKIIVTGWAMRVANSEPIFATLRLNTDGSLDTSFGENGIAWTAVGTNDWAKTVTVQSDDKIIIAGSGVSAPDFTRNFAIVRYNADGSLDATFGVNGIVTTPVGDKNDEVNSLFIQSDGKILAAGVAKYDNFDLYSRFVVVRYLANGLLDSTFDRDGKAITTINADSRASSVVMQKDGKIIVGGRSASSTAAFDDFVLARFNPNGSLDETFGVKTNLPGTIAFDFGNGADAANAIALAPDGKIVGAGTVKGNPGVARFLGE